MFTSETPLELSLNRDVHKPVVRSLQISNKKKPIFKWRKIRKPENENMTQHHTKRVTRAHRHTTHYRTREIRIDGKEINGKLKSKRKKTNRINKTKQTQKEKRKKFLVLKKTEKMASQLKSWTEKIKLNWRLQKRSMNGTAQYNNTCTEFCVSHSHIQITRNHLLSSNGIRCCGRRRL